MRAHQTRRREELKELGTVIAYAFHQPGELDQLLRDGTAPVSGGEKWW